MAVKNLCNLFKTVLDFHAPLRIMSQKEFRLSSKPYITQGIFDSIRTKNKLFKKYMESSDHKIKQFYKK